MKRVFFISAVLLLSVVFILATGTPGTGGAKRFVDHGDGTITDNETRLMWTKNANIPGKGITYPEAEEYIRKINTEGLSGHKDWRMPKIEELTTLIDTKRIDRPSIPTKKGRFPLMDASEKHRKSPPLLPAGHPFKNIISYWYWSTSWIECEKSAIALNMATGQEWPESDREDDRLYLWPVRGTRAE